MSASLKRLGEPRAIAVRSNGHGVPASVGRRRVEAIAEDWVVEDRWWTDELLRRRYFELVLDNGVDLVVFHDLVGGGWFEQRC